MPTTSAAGETSNLRPDDVLGAILAMANQDKYKQGGKSSRLTFKGHDSDLQRVFYDLVNRFHDPLMQVFVFSTKGPTPYSPILSDAISKLQLCGFVGRENPDYENLFIRDAAVDYYKSVIKDKLSAGQVSILEQVASEFQSKVTATY